eukprot:3976056-Prymnesium_polylepis.2
MEPAKARPTQPAPAPVHATLDVSERFSAGLSFERSHTVHAYRVNTLLSQVFSCSREHHPMGGVHTLHLFRVQSASFFFIEPMTYSILSGYHRLLAASKILSLYTHTR